MSGFYMGYRSAGKKILAWVSEGEVYDLVGIYERAGNVLTNEPEWGSRCQGSLMLARLLLWHTLGDISTAIEWSPIYAESVVQRLPESWRMSRFEVRHWINLHREYLDRMTRSIGGGNCNGCGA